MGAVHPLADEAVSAGVPEKSFLWGWPEEPRNAWGRGTLWDEVFCHRKPVSLWF